MEILLLIASLLGISLGLSGSSLSRKSNERKEEKNKTNLTLSYYDDLLKNQQKINSSIKTLTNLSSGYDPLKKVWWERKDKWEIKKK